MGFSRQEYWGGLPFPPPGDLPNPGPGPPALQADSLPIKPQGKPIVSLELGRGDIIQLIIKPFQLSPLKDCCSYHSIHSFNSDIFDVVLWLLSVRPVL